MSDLAEIEALFFALVGGSPGAEVVFLNENLAVRLGAVFRDFDAHFLGTLPHRLLDLINEPRDRLRPVKLNDDCSTVSGRALTQRVAPEPSRPSSICSSGRAGSSDE